MHYSTVLLFKLCVTVFNRGSIKNLCTLCTPYQYCQQKLHWHKNERTIRTGEFFLVTFSHADVKVSVMNSILLKVISVWCAIYSSCQAYSSHGSDFVHINPSVILTFSENLTHNSQDNIEAFGFPRTPRTTDDRPKTRHRRNAANLPTGLAGEEEGGTVNAPSQIFAYKKGDFNIGGMFAVRFPDPKYTDPCSRVLTLTGLRIESMLYAIDFINNSTDILPGVELGFEIRDDCSNKNRALRVITGKICQDKPDYLFHFNPFGKNDL